MHADTGYARMIKSMAVDLICGFMVLSPRGV